MSCRYAVGNDRCITYQSIHPSYATLLSLWARGVGVRQCDSHDITREGLQARPCRRPSPNGDGELQAARWSHHRRARTVDTASHRDQAPYVAPASSPRASAYRESAISPPFSLCGVPAGSTLEASTAPRKPASKHVQGHRARWSLIPS